MRTIIINKMKRYCAALITLFFGAGYAQATVVHEYIVSIDSALETMRVTAEFGEPVRDIRARSRDASRYIIDARDCESDESLRSRGRRLEVGDGVSCLSYVVDLSRAAAAERRTAALAEGTDDPEGDMIHAVRDTVGPDVPVIATLDLHAHVTDEMVQYADALLGWETYPHSDQYPTGVRATRLLLETVRTKIDASKRKVAPVSVVPAPALGCVKMAVQRFFAST